MYLIMCK